MVDDELRRSADELRDMAARLLLLAQRTRSDEARAGLIALAERFVRRAASIDGSGPSDP